MKVLVSGSRGFLGSALLPALRRNGHEAVPLIRSRQPRSGAAWWIPRTGEIAPGALVETGAVVHLAGESIAGGPWTAGRKARIRGSRVGPTRALSEALAALPHKPAVMVCASAVGYYGDRGDQLLTEDAGPGRGFLSEVCAAWEAATRPAAEAGIRVVRLRQGLVIGPGGGLLGSLAPIFRWGFGATLGHGRQYMSWISLEDLVAIYLEALAEPRLCGPVNAVSPQPVTNRDFTRALARALGRPAAARVPAWVLRLALGEMADALILGSARVIPELLNRLGFRFRLPGLEASLGHALRG